MPSKSSKQHRFMEAVAHNPSFAKKAGVPISVGKHFHDADKGKKFREGGHMKRKHYDGTDGSLVPDDKYTPPKTPKVQPKSPKGMTDSEREAQSEGYWADVAHPKPKFKQGGHVKRKMKYADGGMLGSAPGMAVQPTAVQPTQMPAKFQPPPAMMNQSPYQPMGAMTPVGQSPVNYSPIPNVPNMPRGDYFGGISPLSPPQRRPPAFSGQLQYGQGQGMVPPRAYYGASRDLSTIPQIGMPDYGMGGMTSNILHGQPQQALGGNYLGAPSSAGMSNFGMGAGYGGSLGMGMPSAGMSAAPTNFGHKHGGKISRYAKGGNVKHANELHGKAKETKAIAREEMKALKRGHAPKKILEHEKAEHEEMGYKRGGKIQPKMKSVKVPKDETKPVGYKMKESASGRKAPHGKHSSEGDTKLKGFGMGGKSKPGRHVSKAHAGKDETHTKGFAMRRGGGIRKPGIGKALAAAQMLGGMPPSAPPVPGMAGPPGAPPSAPPSGMPGMKKGGHVTHHAHHAHQIHHHHHYAKGGHIKQHHKGHMASGGDVRKGIDERALRGHTKGKQVKMASGGHVGSHPSRRGDGAASKGHTKCKIR